MHSDIRGKCLVRLHRPTEAVQAAERSVATLARTDVRNMAFATVEQTVGLAVQNRSVRLVGEINAARARMQPWQNSRAVTQLGQRLRAYRLAWRSADDRSSQ